MILAISTTSALELTSANSKYKYKELVAYRKIVLFFLFKIICGVYYEKSYYVSISSII